MGDSRGECRRALTYGAVGSAAILAAVATSVAWTRKWALQATYAGGTADYFRDGAAFGEGAVAWFRFKRDAEATLEAMRPALADNVAVRVVRYRRHSLGHSCRSGITRAE